MIDSCGTKQPRESIVIRKKRRPKCRYIRRNLFGSIISKRENIPIKNYCEIIHYYSLLQSRLQYLLDNIDTHEELQKKMWSRLIMNSKNAIKLLFSIFWSIDFFVYSFMLNVNKLNNYIFCTFGINISQMFKRWHRSAQKLVILNNFTIVLPIF